MKAIYSPARLVNSHVAASWGDGVKLLSWVDAHNNPALHLFRGWTDENGKDEHVAEHYMSIDGGVTFTVASHPPYTGRHNNLVIVNKVTNKIIIGLGDGTDNSFATDIWSFDWINGWKLITADCGVGKRQGYATAADDLYVYVIGGYVDYSDSLTNDVWRAPLNDLAAIKKISDTPPEMHNINNAVLLSFKNALYFIGGGRRNYTPPHIASSKVFKSIDRGLTWTKISESDLLNSFIWGDGCTTNEYMILQSGSDANNSLYANRRLLYTEDGIKIKPMIKNIPTRHACAMVEHLGDIYIGMGYRRNDMWMLKKLT